MLLLQTWELLIDSSGDDEMQFLTAALDQGFISRILDQRMLELIGWGRRHFAHRPQLRNGEHPHRPAQTLSRYRMPRMKQVVRKLPTYDRRALRALFGRSQPTEP